MPSRAITAVGYKGVPEDLWRGRHNVDTHTFKAMLVTAVPNPNDATNAAYTEVTGSNYTAGGIDIAATLDISAAPLTILQSAVDLLWPEHASGFTNAAAVVITNVTSGRHIAYGDIRDGAAPVDSTQGSADVNLGNGTDVYTTG